jgi:Flp pilus assembly protein TadG
MHRLWSKDNQPGSNGRNGRVEGGAAMVEFALVLPLLMMFLLGIVTVGITYNRNNSMNNAARESARYGAVLSVDNSLSSWLATVADVAVASATGDMDPTVVGQYVCVAYVYPDGNTALDRTTRLVEQSGVRTESAGQSCFVDGRPDGERRVQIELRRRSDLNALVFTQQITLDSTSVARFERAAD